MLKKARLILILLFALAILLSMILLISNITYGKYLSSAEFDMEFNFNVFDLNYEVWRMAGSGETGDSDGAVWKITDNDTEIEKNSLDSIFGSGRLTNITNNSFYYTVTIDGRYTAEVFLFYRAKNETSDVPAPGTNQTTGKIEKDREGNTVNGFYTDPDTGQTTYWPLGQEPVYVNGSPDPSKGPTTLNLTYTYRNYDAQNNYRVIVKLTEIEEDPEFDARYALGQSGASGRGSSGTYNGDDATNITPEGNWDWGTYANEVKNMTPNKGDTYNANYGAEGTYYHEWVFQTNSGNYLLDSFVVNGQDIQIPFVPRLNKNTGAYDTTDSYEKTTTLPDGTQVKIELLKLFGSTQRVYRVTVFNARSNITVTDMNLMMYESGAQEIVVYTLNGVNTGSLTFGGAQKTLGSLYIFDDSTDTGEIAFKLLDFYEKPTVEVKDINGKTFLTLETKWDNDKECYVVERGIMLSDLKSAGTKLGLLCITAEPMRFAFKYCTGSAGKDVELDSVPPTLDDDGVTYYWLDKNHDYGDAYYTIGGLPEIISVPMSAPLYNGNVQGKNFLYWTYTDWNGNVTQANRERPFYKYNIFQCAAKDENGNYIKTEDGAYIVIFNAVWSDDPVTFTFEEIYAIYCQEWSDMPFDVWYAECWEKWYAEYCDGCYSF